MALVLAVGAASSPAGAVATARTSPVATAGKALLRLTDMPKGWTSSKSSSGGGGAFPGSSQLARCLGVATSVVTSNPPSATSPDFNSADGLLTVSDSASVYSSAASARADYESLANPKAPSCLTTLMNGTARSQLVGQLGAGTHLGKVAVTRAPAADFAPSTANFVMSFPVTSQGTTLKVQLTVTDYVRGDEEQTLTLTAIGASFPGSLSRHLTAVAASRL
ncbi:MAG TPA: hypothetical protein VNF07_13125 [Acidimicrobiales bacterium]|nr:hypothetical protein [Acidimicrobiales bacterium]